MDDDSRLGNIKETITRKGKVLVPELGLGRAQETMLILEEAMKNNKLPKVPIYIDGMIWDINGIHTAYPDFLNSTVRQQIFQGENPFVSDTFIISSMTSAIIAGNALDIFVYKIRSLSIPMALSLLCAFNTWLYALLFPSKCLHASSIQTATKTFS